MFTVGQAQMTIMNEIQTTEDLKIIFSEIKGTVVNLSLPNGNVH
jgi:hypothetical protein